MKRVWIVGVAAAVVAAATVALAQMGPGMMGPGGQPGQGMGPGMMMGPGGMMGGGMMGSGATNDRPWITVMLDHREELALSNEQVGRLFNLRDRFAKEARTKSEALEKVEGALDQLFGPGPVDLQAVEAKLKEAEAVRTDVRMARIKVIEEGKAVLTPEQRAKLVQLAKEPQWSSGGTSQGGPMGTTREMEEMHRFMRSERGVASMNAMMEMARQMGNGDTMLGMTRMMEMMGNMGGMMGMPPGQRGPAK